MSDEVLRLIPNDKCYIPPLENQELAIELLEQLCPEGEMCESEVYKEIEFIDQGTYLEYIICAKCKTKLQFYKPKYNSELIEWWQDLIDKEYDNGFNDVFIKMYCCKESVDITKLEFWQPAGFARFELSIWNPNIGRKLTEEEIKPLEETLCCKLIQIWAHY
jgi:hypothetical protein